MNEIPGSNCATTLFAAGLSFPAVVRALELDVGLTHEDAIRAATATEAARRVPVLTNR
jgi:hypothetical protein